VFCCPACFVRGRPEPHTVTLLAFLAWTALGVALTAVPWVRYFGWLLLNVYLFIAMLGPLLVLRELGRAFCVRLLGLRLFGVWIGHGPLLFSGTVRGVTWEVRAVPDGAAISYGHPDLRFFRLKHFLLALAGTLVSGLLLALALRWWPPPMLGDQLLRWFGAPGLLAIPVFVAADVFLLLISLLPYRARSGGGLFTSDGLLLCLAPFLPRAALVKAHAEYCALEGGRCLADRRDADALGWYERGLEHDPENLGNLLGASWALIRLGQFDAAEQRLDGLLFRIDLGRGVQALVADAVATAVLGLVIEGRRRQGPGPLEGAAWARFTALLDKGERCSQRALDSGARLPAVTQWSMMRTYGSILVEQGKLEEGAAVLRLAQAELRHHPEARAYCLSYLAVVAARQGRPAEARLDLEKAGRLSPGCFALRRAEWELFQGA
jgi:tetratricopeptide (TPR) repeat protein